MKRLGHRWPFFLTSKPYWHLYPFNYKLRLHVDILLSWAYAGDDSCSSHRCMRRENKVLAASGIALALLGGGAVGFEKSYTTKTVITKSEPEPEAHGGLLAKRDIASPIEVVTFNTASGNPTIKTAQKEFLKLPFYQQTINGEPDAPIIGLQEAGPAQVEALSKLAKNGNFSFIYSRSVFSDGGNLLIVPKRFEVLQGKSERYSLTSGIVGIAGSVKAGEFHRNDLSQMYPRMVTEAKLKDKVSGKTFIVFNTHLSYTKSIQQRQSDELFAYIAEANKKGPVVVLGDLNADSHNPYLHGGLLKKHIENAGLSDMGPQSAPRKRGNYDYVLAKGFESVDSRYLFDLSLSGSPTAEQVSDHYAEGDRIRFNH